MKNFFKKLSFVLASAMVITSLYAPANAEAASNFVRVKGTKKAVTSKDIFVGGRKVNFDYTIGKKMTGIHGTWTSSDTSVAVVDKKTGVVKAVSNGTATITFKTKKTKSMKKVVTIKTTVNTFTRAKAVELSTATAEVKLGESLDVTASLISIDKAGSSNSTYNLVASSSDEKIATAKVDGTTISISPIATGSATFTVFARHKNGDKYDTPKVELPVTVIANLSAKQSAANKITVMGKDLSKEAKDYVVKNDKGVVQNLKSVTADKDGNIVLESSLAQYPEGKYVVIYDKNELPLDIEKSMSKVIKLMPEDKAIAVYDTGDNRYKTAFVKYAIYDQFGTDVTGTSLVNVRVTGSHGAATVANEPNKIVFTDNGSLGFQLGISKVSVSLYDLNNTKATVSLNATLDVTNESKIYEAEFVGLWDENASKFVESFEESQDLTKNPIYALYTFKDQYGNVVNHKAGLEKEVNVLPIGITNVTIDYTTPANVIKKVEDKVNKKEYVGFKLSTLTGSKLREGEVELRTSIFTNASKNLVNKFNVTHAVKVHDINIFVGAKGLYAGQKNELAFTATDQDGKPVKAYKYFANKVKLSDNKFSWEATNENDDSSDAKLIYDASAVTVAGTTDTASQPFYFVATTETNQIKQFNLSINKKKFVAGVTGLQDKVAVGVTKDNFLTIKYTDLKFQDQYGGSLTLKEIVEDLGYNNNYYLMANFTDDDQATSFTQDETTGGNQTQVIGAKTNTTAKLLNGNSLKDDTNDGNAPKKLHLASNVMAYLKAVGEKSVTEQIKVSLHSAAATTNDNIIGSPLLIDLHSVVLKDVADVKVTEPKVQSVADAYKQDNTGYTTTDLATLYDFLPEVTGKYRGQTIKLVNKNDFTIIDGADTGNFVNVPKLEVFKNQANTVKELEASFKLLFKTGEITETKYKFTKDKPVITKISIRDDKKAIVDDTAHGTARTWTTIATSLKLEDQFGREKLVATDVAPYIVFTKAGTTEENARVTITNNATTSAQFTLSEEGTYKVKVKIVIGNTIFEGLIKGNAS